MTTLGGGVFWCLQFYDVNLNISETINDPKDSILSQGHNMVSVYNLSYLANKNHNQTLMPVKK